MRVSGISSEVMNIPTHTRTTRLVAHAYMNQRSWVDILELSRPGDSVEVDDIYLPAVTLAMYCSTIEGIQHKLMFAAMGRGYSVAVGLHWSGQFRIRRYPDDLPHPARIMGSWGRDSLSDDFVNSLDSALCSTCREVTRQDYRKIRDVCRSSQAFRWLKNLLTYQFDGPLKTLLDGSTMRDQTLLVQWLAPVSTHLQLIRSEALRIEPVAIRVCLWRLCCRSDSTKLPLAVAQRLLDAVDRQLPLRDCAVKVLGIESAQIGVINRVFARGGFYLYYPIDLKRLVRIAWSCSRHLRAPNGVSVSHRPVG